MTNPNANIGIVGEDAGGDASSNETVPSSNATALRVLEAIQGLGGIVSQIKAATAEATASIRSSKVVAVNAITTEKEHAISAIRAATPKQSSNADNPNFQTSDRITTD